MAKILMKGNEAFGKAAMVAGCKYFFGYPITPQSELPEYLSRETFSEEKYVEEQEKYGKFLLTECFKDLIGDNVLEKLNNGKDYLEKEDIEVIIEDISKEKKNLDLKYEDKLNEEKNEKSEKSTNNKKFDYEEIKEKNDKGREYDF